MDTANKGLSAVSAAPRRSAEKWYSLDELAVILDVSVEDLALACSPAFSFFPRAKRFTTDQRMHVPAGDVTKWLGLVERERKPLWRWLSVTAFATLLGYDDARSVKNAIKRRQIESKEILGMTRICETEYWRLIGKPVNAQANGRGSV